MVVGPPAGASPWHDILHGWNKMKMLSDCAGMKTTYVTCMKTGKQIAFYVLGTLDPQDFGIERRNTTSTGEIAFEKYFIWRGFDNWIVEAVAHDRWMVMNRGCAFFVLYDCLFFLRCFCLHLDGAVFGPRTFDWILFDVRRAEINVIKTAAVGKSDCRRPAPAITSSSPVGCAATACLGHAGPAPPT